jgi:hypothetical protein
VIIKGSEQIKETFAAGGQTAFSGTLVFNDASVKSQADYANKQLSKVHLIRVWVPLTLAVLGVVLIVVGALLLFRRSRRQPLGALRLGGRRTDRRSAAELERQQGYRERLQCAGPTKWIAGIS